MHPVRSEVEKSEIIMAASAAFFYLSCMYAYAKFIGGVLIEMYSKISEPMFLSP